MSVLTYLRSLWEEIKRRRVPQLLLAYLGGVVATLEGSDLILSGLGVSPEAIGGLQSVLTIFWVAVFPLTLTLTWLYKMVPEREASPSDDDGPEMVAGDDVPKAKGLPASLVIVVVAGGCMMLATSMWPPEDLAQAAPLPRDLDVDGLALISPEVLRGGDETEVVGDVLINRLTSRLAPLPGIRVRSAPTVWALGKTSEYPEDSLGSVLGVGTVITSTVEGFEGSFRITLRVVDVPTRDLRETISLTGEMPRLDGTFEEFTDTLEVEVRRALGRARPTWAEQMASPEPSAQQGLVQVQAQQAAFRTHMAQGDVDEALDALRRADELLLNAMRVDERWPLVLRSWVANARALVLLTPDRPAAMRALQQARRYADQALSVAPGDAEALRLRGVAAYRTAAVDTSATVDRAGLLASAEADLLAAQGRHRDRAQVLYWLAQVKREQGSYPEAYRIARDAYEFDAFLNTSDQLLSQMFSLAFDLSRDREAAQWCDVGRTRFPEEWVFLECRLKHMAWGGVPPDTVEANVLMADIMNHYPPPFRSVMRPRLELYVAGVHVQVGNTREAASRVAIIPLDAPPAIARDAAGVWLLLGEPHRAMEFLRRYIDASPSNAEVLPLDRTLEPLWGQTDFEALVGGRS